MMTEVRRYAPYVPCPTCTANRPRLCDLHYRQGAEAFLQAVKHAIADPRTPDGVKAAYEELLAQNRALAAREQALERDNRTYIDERHELLTKNEALIQQLAEAQGTIAAYEQCQQEIARAVGYTEGQKLTRHSFILKTIGQAEQQVARLRMLIYRLLNDLPTNRDWLDPDLERALKGA